MKKIITAIGNETLNNILKKENDICVLTKDIQYREGIIEILEENKEVDIIILSNLLQGEITTKQLIQKINEINQKIKIIIIVDDNEDLENYSSNKGIFKIIKNNELEIKELLKIINDNNENNEELKEEIKKLKDIILENKNKEKNFFVEYIKSKKSTLSKKTKNVDKNLIYPQKTKIINITGPNGVGKSVVSVNLAKINSYQKNKILIIDFNFNNYSIGTILGVKKYPIKNSENILENIIKVNKKINFILGEFLLNSENKINEKKIKELKNNYNLIIIDLSPYNYAENLIYLYNISDFNLFLSDTNLLEISKSINLLNIFINKYKINKNKFNIVFNKYNSESINLKLLEKIFSEFKILGYLKFNKNYNHLINKNKKSFIGERKIRNEISYINKKINKRSEDYAIRK